MRPVVHSPSVTGCSSSQSDTGSQPDAGDKASVVPFSFFQSIPPERTGFSGEYDHYGLAKRVDRALRDNFPPQVLERLKVAQRGRVVVFGGRVPNAHVLSQLVALAASVSGATAVETLAVRFDE